MMNNKILLMGNKRSGKSSVYSVVFEKLSSNETVYLEPTTSIVKNIVSGSPFVDFEIWEFPGIIDLNDRNLVGSTLENTGAIVFVIDAQDSYVDLMMPIQRLFGLVLKHNAQIHLHILVHKSDGLTDEQKNEIQFEIQAKIEENVYAPASTAPAISFSMHITSIYDHSIYEAFSKIVQKLLVEYPVLENMLNSLVSKSGIEKAFLFDVTNKLHIATDSSPVDMQMYELCCDMLDVVIDVSNIYGKNSPGTPEPYTKRDFESAPESPLSFDEQSASVIKFGNGLLLYLREVGRYLALVSIISEDSFKHKDFIDNNILHVKNTLKTIVSLSK